MYLVIRHTKLKVFSRNLCKSKSFYKISLFEHTFKYA
jgi:hypothetical protein